jgi:hypothetical protein
MASQRSWQARRDGQVTQLTDRFGWHERAAHQAVGAEFASQVASAT